LQTNLFAGTSQKTLKIWKILVKSAAAHNSKCSRTALEVNGATKVPDRPYNPDMTGSDLYLFGNLKEKLESESVAARGNPISAIAQMFSDTPQDEFIAVYQNWMGRLRWVIKSGGQCDKN
jgi:hypothetical protein